MPNEAARSAGYISRLRYVDLFEPLEVTTEIKQRMLALAGPGSEIHRRQRLYVQFVANGIPFLPNPPAWRALPSLDQKLSSFTIAALDVADVVVNEIERDVFVVDESHVELPGWI